MIVIRVLNSYNERFVDIYNMNEGRIKLATEERK